MIMAEQPDPGHSTTTTIAPAMSSYTLTVHRGSKSN